MQITIDILNPDSITKAANRVKKLQRFYVNRNREFVKRLTAAGIQVMRENLTPENGDSEPPIIPTSPHVMMGKKDGHLYATLRLRGEDVMFVEFGAGVHFNGPAGSSPNPKGVELGYTIGSYGLGLGKMDTWVYEKDGVYHISEGTQASMPMWKADQEIRQKFASIARDVFGNTNGV